jgi:molecular chaperone GrpE (heat shock protein)
VVEFHLLFSYALSESRLRHSSVNHRKNRANTDKLTGCSVNGLRLIHQRFSDVLHANAVTPFVSEGEPFDPTVHEAMTVIDSDEEESGTVYSEHRPGYFINGELLRPARVAVLK